tara:strand:+ start:9278 stop:10069 length:792 start_codon:yes stop_codon:yes gene_type:complete
MSNKILIIGKKSFIGFYLKKYLSKFYIVDCYSFEDFIKKKKFKCKYSHVINTSIHKKYIKKKYNIKFDLDRNIIKYFKDKKFKYFFFNTRKIYKPKLDISERTKPEPMDQYAKNKIITEKYLYKILKKNLISLRISNVIGKRQFIKRRKTHDLFLDNYIKFKKINKKINVENNFKDFISIDYLCIIIKNLIQKEVTGIYNVSISKKIYISEITKWLSLDFFKKINFVKSDNDSFTLSNKKLLKKININFSKKQLKIFCRKLNI